MKRGMQRSVGFCVRRYYWRAPWGLSFAPRAVAQEATAPPVSRSQTEPRKLAGTAESFRSGAAGSEAGAADAWARRAASV